MSRNLGAYSEKLRIVTLEQIQNINRSSDPFEELYSTTGTGFISSFELSFNTPDILLRFEVDSQEVFNIDAESFYQNLREFDGVTREIFVTNQDFFVFQPKFPLYYKEGFKIEAKSNDNGTWKDFEFGYVMYEAQ